MTHSEYQRSGLHLLEDARLVANARAGGPEAFGVIVERYQNLICALAYSQTGSRSQSEDLAQETFVAAWKHLAELREPEKLRGWLCGISRNLTRNWLRSHHRENAGKSPAEILEDLPGIPSTAADQVIQKEEEAILWQSLKKIPDLYREPLVLYYREHQSVEAVARALEISEETVRQRLSRGRKLLHQEVLTRVEGALLRSAPGKAFTLGVVAVLPAFSASSAAAAAITAGAAKTGVAAQSVLGAGLFAALFGPLLGLLGSYFGVKASVENTHSPRERAFAVKMCWRVSALALLFSLGMAALLWNSSRLLAARPGLFISLLIGGIFLYAAILISLIYFANKSQARIRTEEFKMAPPSASGFEFRSAARWLGLPLLHIKFGNAAGLGRSPARGWIAIGDSAVGVLVAVGGVAVGGIAIGGVACGIFSAGGLSVGGLAIGGLGMGWIAAGGACVAWKAAFGGAAIAHGYAIGGVAVGAHANDPLAQEYFAKSLFIRMAKVVAQHGQWLALLAFTPLFFKKKWGRGKNGG